MLDDLISAYGNRFLVAALGVSLALLCLFIVLWILRNRAPSPFVRGGRNRQPRLQVLDAAAVDTRRRIVLIRRDNVEHLVMIGGPTDIVIESGIGDERAYLSARAVNPLPLEEQSELPKPAEAPGLATTEPPAARIAAPSPAASMPIDLPTRRPSAPQTPPAEPAPVQARAAQAPAPAVEQRRPQAAPVRPAEPTADAQPAPAVAPVVASPIVAAVAAAPVATAPTRSEAEITPAAPPESPKPEPVARVTPAFSPAPEAPVTRPTASLEPVMAAEVNTSFDPVRQDTETARTEPAMEPAVTSGTPPIEVFRVEPVEPVKAEVKPEPASETQTPRPPMQSAPDLGPAIDAPAAEDLLEAARQRVLASSPAPVLARPFEAQKFEPPAETRQAAQDPQPAARDMSDFERVLEEEMALHLASDPTPAQTPRVELPQILPETRADRPRLPATAILPAAPPSDQPGSPAAQVDKEPNLQNEIARIFGEMSASRNP